MMQQFKFDKAEDNGFISHLYPIGIFELIEKTSFWGRTYYVWDQIAYADNVPAARWKLARILKEREERREVKSSMEGFPLYVDPEDV